MIKLRDLLPEAIAHETKTLLQVWKTVDCSRGIAWRIQFPHHKSCFPVRKHCIPTNSLDICGKLGGHVEENTKTTLRTYSKCESGLMKEKCKNLAC